MAPIFARITKTLLVSAYDSVDQLFLSGVRRFTGEVYAAYGEADQPAAFLAMMLSTLARSARAVRVRSVAGCDHFFSGETNDRAFSQAYLWAFAGDEAFPLPDGGLAP